MSLTNAEVHTRFLAGRTGANGRRSMVSDVDPETGTARLFSYTTVVAIRRPDGAIFSDGHRYSVSTSQHQLRSGASLSFQCAETLAGRDWWTEAEIVDTLPQWCRSRDCKDRHAYECEFYCAAVAARSADIDARAEALHGPTPDFPGYAWSASERERRARAIAYDRCQQWRQHRQTIDRETALVGASYPPECYKPGERGHRRTVDQGWDWALLRLPEFDMLCGSDRGRAYADAQLFCIRLRIRCEDVPAALYALNPWREYDGVLRQGEFFFRPVDASFLVGRLDDRTPGVLHNAAIPQVNDRGDTRHPHIAMRLYIGPGGTVYVRGTVQHDQHRRITLGDRQTWYEVRRAADAGAVSSPLSHPMGYGRAGFD